MLMIEQFWKIWLLVCPLVFLAGFVDAVAGGGGIISLPAYMMAGIPMHMAAGTNKVVNGTGTLASTVKYIRSGKVDLKVALWAAVGALLGAGLGTNLALHISEQLLQILITAALPCVAVFLMLKKDFGKDPIPRSYGLWKGRTLSFLIGLGIGCYDGLVGPGTGTFMIMAFTLVLGIDLLTASGCAKAANLASNVASAVVWIVGGKVMWEIVLPAVIFIIAGNQCGARYAIRGGSDKVRGMIFVVLGLLFVKMIFEVLL